MLALLAVPFLDELASGVAPAGAPDVARDLALPPGLAAGGIVTAFYGLALLEAPLLAWSERVSARRFSTVSLALMGLSALAMALAGSPLVLALALAAYGPAAGCALAVAEGVLVESGVASRERVMARITLAAALGDLVVPALLWAASTVALGWRAVAGIAAATGLVLALSHAAARGLDRPAPEHDDDEGHDEPRPSMREALRTALGDRALLGWTLAGTLTGLLDEVLVAFTAVHLEHASALGRALGLGALIAGGLAGLWWLERWVDRMDARRVLLVACAVSAAALVALAASTDIAIATLALTALGASSATLHPLAKARAYAALPGRPALVNAAAAALVPIDALAPLAIGAVALSLGSGAALATLLIAPLGIACAAWMDRRAQAPR